MRSYKREKHALEKPASLEKLTSDERSKYLTVDSGSPQLDTARKYNGGLDMTAILV
jgi:hypothetical protein